MPTWEADAELREISVEEFAHLPLDPAAFVVRGVGVLDGLVGDGAVPVGLVLVRSGIETGTVDGPALCRGVERQARGYSWVCQPQRELPPDRRGCRQQQWGNRQAPWRPPG
jgi:hypothetical protein